MKISDFVKMAVLGFGFALYCGASNAATIRIGGTGMVLGLMQSLKGPFERNSPQDQLIVVPGLGSGGGIAALADSALDVVASGRLLKDREKARNLILHPFIETPFVFVSNTSSSLAFSSQDLVDIFSGEKVYLSDGLRARVILRPEGDSVTSFLKREFAGMEEALQHARSIRGIPVAQTDQENLQLAQKMVGAVTAITMSQHHTEPNTLRLITIDGFDAEQAISGNGSYPYNTNAWIVTHKKITPAVQRFLDFLKSPDALDVYKSSGAKPVQQ